MKRKTIITAIVLMLIQAFVFSLFAQEVVKKEKYTVLTTQDSIVVTIHNGVEIIPEEIKLINGIYVIKISETDAEKLKKYDVKIGDISYQTLINSITPFLYTEDLKLSDNIKITKKS